MATLATFFRRPAVVIHRAETIAVERPVRVCADPYALRELPCEDVYFHTKHIDNSRIVREDNPQSRHTCWMSIGVATVIVAVLTTVAAPSVYGTISGYKLQSLLQEQKRLLEERKSLEVREAQMLNPMHLQELANANGKTLVKPRASQVIKLDPKSNEALASVFERR